MAESIDGSTVDTTRSRRASGWLGLVRSHPLAVVGVVVAVSAAIAVGAGGGAGDGGTQRVRTVSDQIAAPATTGPPAPVPEAAAGAPAAGEPAPGGPAGVVTTAAPADPQPATTVPVNDPSGGEAPPSPRPVAASPDDAGDATEPSAPRSWSDRIFFSQESIAFEQPSAVWSVDRDGGDARIEARGLINGPGDQFTEGARLGFDVSPDRSTLLYGQYEAVPYWDVRLSEIHALRPGQEPVRVASRKDLVNPRFAPDGQSFVVATESEAQVLDLDGNVLRTFAEGADFNGNDDFAWSPSGDRIALALSYGPVQLIDVASGATIRVLPIANADLAWSPAGTTLAVSGRLDGVGGVHLFDTATWDATTVFESEFCTGIPCATTTGVSWTPDGRNLVLTGAGAYGTLHELDLESGDLRLLYESPTLLYRPKVT